MPSLSRACYIVWYDVKTSWRACNVTSNTVTKNTLCGNALALGRFASRTFLLSGSLATVIAHQNSGTSSSKFLRIFYLNHDKFNSAVVIRFSWSIHNCSANCRLADFSFFKAGNEGHSIRNGFWQRRSIIQVTSLHKRQRSLNQSANFCCQFSYSS